jgi:ketosteroid isomerase-like protein
MLEWFTENSFFPACLGILLAVCFLGMWVASSEKLMLKLGLIFVLVTVLTVVTEILIVTDRESVENALYDMASGMRENDFDRVFAYLNDEDLVRRAKGELRDATCHGCNITAVNSIEVENGGEQAVADFVAFAKASNKQFNSPVPIQRRIKLDLKKDGNGRWRVMEFETSNPRDTLRL